MNMSALTFEALNKLLQDLRKEELAAAAALKSARAQSKAIRKLLRVAGPSVVRHTEALQALKYG
jgi:hypothetical protein